MSAFPYSSFICFVLSPLLVVAPVWAQTPASPVSATAAAGPDVLQVRVVNVESLTGNHANGKQSFSVEVTDGQGAAVENAAVVCRLPDSGATGTFKDGTHAAVAYTDNKGLASIDGLQWGSAGGSVPVRLTATKGNAHTGTLIDISLAGLSGNSGAAVPAVISAEESTVVSVPMPAPAAAQVAAPSVSVTRPGQPVAKSPAQPGQLATQPVAASGAEAESPGVSVTKTSAADAPHSSHKWLIILAVVAAAGAGAAFAMKGKSSTSSSTNSSVSIGNPSVSVGTP